MDRNELIEWAGLDALGLLDRDEQERFEAAFRRADSALKAELRAIQDAAVALSGALLPPVAPDAAVAERVLAAVSERIAMEQESSILTTPSLKHRVLGAVERHIHEDLYGSVQHETPYGLSYAGRRDWVERLASGRVSPVWRVAALIFATATLAFGFFAVSAYTDAMRMARDVSTGRVDEVLRREFGHLPEEFWLHPEAQLQTFGLSADAGEGFPGRAMVAVINSQDRGFLTARNLPETDQRYRLCVGMPDRADEAVTLATFEASGETVAVPFALEGRDVTGMQWWVMGPSAASGSGSETVMVPLLETTP